MKSRPECKTCELYRGLPERQAAKLCGLFTKFGRPRSYIIVERQSGEYLWTLFRTDDLSELRRRHLELQQEDPAADFVVLRWVPSVGYQVPSR